MKFSQVYEQKKNIDADKGKKNNFRKFQNKFILKKMERMVKMHYVGHFIM